MARWRHVAAWGFMVACVTTARGEAGMGVRQEIPIARTRLADGAIRYSVPLSIDGGASMQAMLDTGSTGLRLVRQPPSAAKPGDGASLDFAYTSGVMVSGRVVPVELRLGGANAWSTSAHFIESIGCVEARPHCPASMVGYDTFGFGGDGVPGAGFPAILGIAMRPADAKHPWAHPLEAGAERWLVEAPRAFDAHGRLVLNPSDDELRGFEYIPLAEGAGHAGVPADAVQGCVAIDQGAEQCGPLVLDLGANGIRLTGAGEPSGDGAKVRIRIGHAEVRFVSGQRPPLDRFFPQPQGRVTSLGALPFMFWTVLYDPAHHRIGLRPRERGPEAEAGR